MASPKTRNADSTGASPVTPILEGGWQAVPRHIVQPDNEPVYKPQSQSIEQLGRCGTIHPTQEEGQVISRPRPQQGER